MKKVNSNYLRYMAIGILVMNAGAIANFFIHTNEFVIDFFKGLGIVLVIASFWLAVKKQKCVVPSPT